MGKLKEPTWDTPLVTYSIKMPQEVLDRLRLAARQERRGVSNFINWALEQFLDVYEDVEKGDADDV